MQNQKNLTTQNKSVVSSANNTPYIVAVVILGTITVIASVLITILRPDRDNTSIISLIFASALPTIVAFLALMKAQETHLSVNSRLDEFMKNAKENARNKGVIEGREEANQRTDTLAKKNK